jgi:arylsulfatase A-like enzyme
MKSRRELLQSIPVGMAALTAQASGAQQSPPARPNIIFIISDQFRADCVGAAGLNPMNLTPNLDAMARRGTFFRSAFCNQPVCAPARGTIFTGLYPVKHGVWKNAIPLPVDSVTIASELRKSGYSANYIGKWHLGLGGANKTPDKLGPVPPENRGGFLDLWQASDVLEMTSHAYEGDLYDNDGKPMHFSGEYRTDFMTGLAAKFLRSPQSKPFFLTLSYLEVHHQNDIDAFVAPKGYAERYKNPFIPQDLRPLPGSWTHQLADYFGCVAKMDETVGEIRKLLVETGLDRNTILVFTSDHGCHFKTRNTEYKRSPHDSSLHIPLIIEGPGFNGGREVRELVSQIDYAPTLISAGGVTVPEAMPGKNLQPLAEGRAEGWTNEVYSVMSEYMTGRILRTPQYTYAAAVPKTPGWKAAAASPSYTEYMLYDNYADPFQHLNVAGRVEYKAICADLRRRLTRRIFEAEGTHSTIEPTGFPYC